MLFLASLFSLGQPYLFVCYFLDHTCNAQIFIPLWCSVNHMLCQGSNQGQPLCKISGHPTVSSLQNKLSLTLQIKIAFLLINSLPRPIPDFSHNSLLYLSMFCVLWHMLIKRVGMNKVMQYNNTVSKQYRYHGYCYRYAKTLIRRVPGTDLFRIPDKWNKINFWNSLHFHKLNHCELHSYKDIYY